MAWFRFDMESWTADTPHLTAAEEGAYLRLLIFYYRSRVPLPESDRALANIARVSEADWTAMRETVRAFFKRRGDKLVQKRVSAELDREDALARTRSEHAKNAARKRHARSTTSMRRAKHEQDRATPEHVLSDAQGMLDDATRADVSKNPPIVPQGPKARRQSSLSAEDADAFATWYQTYPRHVARGAAERAYAKARQIASIDALQLGAAKAARQFGSTETRYVPHPSSWLSAQRWLDDDRGEVAQSANGSASHENGETSLWRARLTGWLRPGGTWLPAWPTGVDGAPDLSRCPPGVLQDFADRMRERGVLP